MNDQPHNKDFEKLLKSLESKRTEGLDDFEREALEGFDSLDSKEEALQIKSELDKKIHDQLFTEKKQQPKVYWFAAAGLFMVIGLSVFFIIKNNGVASEKDVAVVQSNIPKETLEESPALAPPEEKTSTVSTGEVSETNRSNKSTNLKQLERKDESTVSPRSVLAPVQTSGEKPDNNLASTDKRDDGELDDQVTTATGKSVAKDADREPNLETKFKSAEEQKNESPSKEIDKLAKTETKKSVTDEEGKKSSFRSKNKRKEGASSRANEDESKAVVEKAPSNAGPGTSGISQNNDVLKNNANSTPKTSADTKAAPSYNIPEQQKTETYDSPDNSCYYSGGLTELTTDLRGKLIEKNVNKQFDALLNINEKKEVVKVNYLNVYDLTTVERDKVTEVLKSLKKFNFYIQPNIKGLFEYKLIYKP
ncbi:MAG: hypothetical protein H0W61_10710 [Bacteroidetes bacterium]|nr:hypothetical protein [Bacteroidota bacterium]